MAFTQQQKWDRQEARKNSHLCKIMLRHSFDNRDNNYGESFAIDAAFFARYAAKATFNAHPELRVS